jgi:mRNA interferase MazF
MNPPHPGEVWLAELGQTAKDRPIIILSRHDPEAARTLAIYVPITSKYRGSEYEVKLPKLRFLSGAYAESFVNVQAIGSVLWVKLYKRLGSIAPDLLTEIHRVLFAAIGVDVTNGPTTKDLTATKSPSGK